MPLSDAKLRALKPKAKSYKVSDFEGLYVTVMPSGSRLWHLKYRIGRREKRLSFGAYPSVTLAEARKLKDEARAVLAAGGDPGIVKQERKRAERERRGITFAAQADAFIDKARREGKASATMVKTEWLLQMACSDFGATPISEVSAPTILTCLRRVEAKGNYETARRLRAKIGAVFRYAVANGLAETDPTYALRDALIRPTVTPRAAITEPKALGGLLRAIDGFHGQATTRIALQLLALLVQRPGELRFAKWDEIDLVQKIWSIPGERMKMRRPHRVPLPEKAVDLIRTLQAVSGQSAFLFPSLRSLHRPMSENTLNAALRRLGYSGQEMTAHGFRATFSTLANESNLWNPDAIERQLAHVETNTVRRAYDRGEHWEERRKMMDWWSDYLDAQRKLANP
ncbi:tyrosine-type recombinase/integrase [Planktotalea arctica]|uniref:tyrosine-type recombinase/integrase n=1 Tax=Planktotalea arctica TaxID=1481893 RepID=UPI0032199B23